MQDPFDGLSASDYAKLSTKLRQNDAISKVMQSDMCLQNEQKRWQPARSRVCRCSLLKSEHCSLPPRRITPSPRRDCIVLHYSYWVKPSSFGAPPVLVRKFAIAPLVPNTCVQPRFPCLLALLRTSPFSTFCGNRWTQAVVRFSF